jgi:AhpD family alkylhydroperoxidase
MARIDLDLEHRARRVPLSTRIALAFARRKFGADLDSARAMSHHPGVLWPWSLMEMAGERRRSRLPEHLADLVVLTAAVKLGCSWCVDFGSSLWERKGLDPAVVADVVRWRQVDRFDDDTRAAFAYAEAASGDLDDVTDEMVADLRRRFGEAGLVELAYLVALENMRSRFNASLGLTSQGFSSGEACSLAARQWAGARG